MNWPPIREPRSSQFGRGRRFNWWLALLLAGLALFVLTGRTWVSYYVDALWFGSLGYAQVFWKTLGLQWGIFAGFAAATFLILYGAFLLLWRSQFMGFLRSQTIIVAGEPMTVRIEPLARVAAVGGSLLIAILAGTFMEANWPTLALFWYAPQAAGGAGDPIFGRPLTFYLLTLPAWQLVSAWLLLLALILCAAAVAFVLISGSALERLPRNFAFVSWREISMTASFLLLVVALRVYLGRFARLYESHTVFSGVTYADAHVMLPGLLVVCAALLVGSAIALANALWIRRARWLVAAILPAAVCFLALQAVNWYVSSFIVKPNELVRERPYIANNIQLTRQAYGLDRMVRSEFPAETSVAAADAPNNQVTIQNIRLWDWRALQDTLRQLQEIRTYYDFPDIDIDRYELNGQMREVMLAARELSVAKLPESSRNWINEKLIYTHGYGVTMNAVNGFTSEGLPELVLSNMPVESSVPGPTVTRPEIYFGELTNTDVYVKTRQKEFNYPQGQSNSLTSYQGEGGIAVGGLLRRGLLALDRGDLAKLPFSDDVTEDSRLLMRRNVRTRVATLAPFLTFDPDPYIVIGDNGKLYWMLDAFTMSADYPYSTHANLGGRSINYMRNSVKVVVDAYDGTTSFYVFDSQDPIIQAYRRVFPALFQDAAAMPPDLRKHVRYPTLLLQLQADVYGLYHMTDPEVFYNKEDLWTVASEVGGQQQSQTMQPNFVYMRLPGETDAEFVEILPFTPANRNNLIGWIAGRSDGPHYGTAVVYDFPKTRLVDGPLQIEARIDQNAELSSQLTLWNQQGSQVQRGNLLVIPTGRALLYAEPIYLQAERSPMPELRLVVLALQDRLAYGPNFESALTALFEGGTSSLTTTAAPAPSAQPAKASVSADDTHRPAASHNPLITQAAQALSDYQRLTAQGKLAEAGQKLEQLKRALDQLNTSN